MNCGLMHLELTERKTTNSPITQRTEGGFLFRLKISFSWLPDGRRKAGAHKHTVPRKDNWPEGFCLSAICMCMGKTDLQSGNCQITA
jgi:hypothetical protein